MKPSATDTKPLGHVTGPLLVIGSVSLVLGFVAEFLGVFNGLETSLSGVWKNTGNDYRGAFGVTSPAGVLLGAAMSYGLVGAILGTPGRGRQLILGVSGFFLGIALIPTLGVWGIFWKPFGFGLLTLWAWFSAMIYAHGHRMPCEGPLETEARNVISLDDERPPGAKSERVNG